MSGYGTAIRHGGADYSVAMARTLTIIALALFGGTQLFGQTVSRSALHDYRVVTYVDALVQPWSIAFLPGGDTLITERPGRLRIVRNGKLLPNAVEGVPEVVHSGQGGLLEVAPHPNFATNRLLYLTYSKKVGEPATPKDPVPATTALIRGRFENDRLTNVEQLFQSVSQGRGHFGGKIAFDKNGLPVSLARRSPGAARGQSRGASGAGPHQPSRQDDPSA